MTVQFQKAERSQVRLKIGIQGPSGSGKTDGALAIARSIVGPTGKIALADTENASASLYSDRYNFDTVGIAPPYLSAKYEEVIDVAAEAGYDALVIDSISHQWDGDGGILARKEATDARGGNSYTNWRAFTKEYNQFVGKILSAPIHIIVTMRSKQDYVLEANDKGKTAPKKVGMKAIQREGAEYELTVNFDVQMDHRAKASKDRTNLFGDHLWDLRDPKTGKMLVEWLSSAKPVALATPEQRNKLQLLADAVGMPEQYATRIGELLRTQLTEDKAAATIEAATKKLNTTENKANVA
jgi:hypothetical protein